MRTASACMMAGFLVSGLAEAKDLDPAKFSSHVRRFIEDVVYVVEKGDRDKCFTRLPSAVAVRCHGAPGYRALLQDKCREFSQATGVGLEVTDAPDPKAVELLVHFGAQEALLPIAHGHDKQIVLASGWAYWKWWSAGYEVTKAVVFICTDKLTEPQVADRLVECLLGVAGMPAKSDVAVNSCLHTVEAHHAQLTDLDAKALKFLYQHVPAGTKPAELRQLVRDKWQD